MLPSSTHANRRAAMPGAQQRKRHDVYQGLRRYKSAIGAYCGRHHVHHAEAVAGTHERATSADLLAPSGAKSGRWGVARSRQSGQSVRMGSIHHVKLPIVVRIATAGDVATMQAVEVEARQRFREI